MRKASDVTNRAIVQFCREHKRVEEAPLEEWVCAQVRQNCGHKPPVGVAWKCLMHMLKTGQVEGAVKGRVLYVEKARLSVPKKKKQESKQESWGWER